MTRRTVAVALTLILATAAPVQAQTAVIAARSSGLIGERFDGYLGAVGPLPAGLRSQVAAINIKRRALFSDLASRRGVSTQEVGYTTACALFARVAAGEVYMLTEGQWRRRGPGEAAPRPVYCG